MKAINIKWNIDIEEAQEMLDNMTVEAAADALKIPKDMYAYMSTAERHGIAHDRFHHNFVDIVKFIGAPEEVEIPKEIGNDEDAISDWLSDEYGWCHEGFDLAWSSTEEKAYDIAVRHFFCNVSDPRFPRDFDMLRELLYKTRYTDNDDEFKADIWEPFVDYQTNDIMQFIHNLIYDIMQHYKE